MQNGYFLLQYDMQMQKTIALDSQYFNHQIGIHLIASAHLYAGSLSQIKVLLMDGEEYGIFHLPQHPWLHL